MSRIEEGESIDIKDKTRSKLRKLLGFSAVNLISEAISISDESIVVRIMLPLILYSCLVITNRER